MLKNTEGKEVDVFEQEMEDRIAKTSTRNSNHPFDDYHEGLEAAYSHALAIYRGCQEGNTI